jgi:hypothetical protein
VEVRRLCRDMDMEICRIMYMPRICATIIEDDHGMANDVSCLRCRFMNLDKEKHSFMCLPQIALNAFG